MKTKVITGRPVTNDDLDNYTLVVTTEYQKVTSHKLCGEFKMVVLTKYYLAIGNKYTQYQVAYTRSELTFTARPSLIGDVFFLTQIKLLDTTIDRNLAADTMQCNIGDITDLQKALEYTPLLEDIAKYTQESIYDFVGNIYGLSEEIHAGAYVDEDCAILNKYMFDELLIRQEEEKENGNGDEDEDNLE